MISLTINVSNISTILEVFDVIQIRKYTGTGTPSEPVTDAMASTDYTTVSGGIDTINSRTGVSDVNLGSSYTQYYFQDPDGYSSDWYISRYYNTSSLSATGWSDPVPGDLVDLYYNPQYPDEAEYDTADQLVIDRIRLLIGDPLELVRECGEEALASVHPDLRTYEMNQKGWPVYISIKGQQYTQTDNPAVNGYRFLRFSEYIDDVCDECVTYSGCDQSITKTISYGVDIWYRSFRFSDKQIMAAYDNCPPPTPLTTTTANAEVYMVQTAIDLLRSELWEDSVEDGASIRDEGSTYDPEPGLRTRRDLLKDLTKRRDYLVKSLQLNGITGVLID